MEPVADYYTILGIAPTASVDEVQSAYRRLARTYHPDRNGGGVTYVERMKAINAARDLLSNPVRRAVYDARRAEGARLRETAHPYHRGSGHLHRDGHHRSRHRTWHDHRTDAGWMSWLATIVACFFLCWFGIGDALSGHAGQQDAVPLSIKTPATPNLNLSLDPHPEICQVFQHDPNVFWAESDEDGDSITVTMNSDTWYPNRLVVAWRADAMMNERLHQGIDDHVSSIRIVTNQGSEPPIMLSQGRQFWKVHLPDRR